MTKNKEYTPDLHRKGVCPGWRDGGEKRRDRKRGGKGGGLDGVVGGSKGLNVSSYHCGTS